MNTSRFEPPRIREHLSRLARDPHLEWHDRVDLEIGEFHDAAVLIPLTEVEGEFQALFTHRADHLEKHSGEVSFPGGGVEPEDNTRIETALREAYEEVALQPEDVDVFGALTEMPTVTGFDVIAYVGEFPQPYELIASPDEIESMFLAPLTRLADPAIHRIESREYAGTTFPIHFFEFEGYTIWGATGWLVYTLLEFLELVEPERTSPS